MSSHTRICSYSPRETLLLGRLLGELLRGGEFIELCGPLGAGKTQLAKGLAIGLGVAPDEPIVSPTFVLVREYAGRLTFYHCDAYRLQTAEELRALGLDEMLANEDGVVALEWADRFPTALAAHPIRIEIEYEDDRSARTVRVSIPSLMQEARFVDRVQEGGFHLVQNDDHQAQADPW